MSPRFLRWTGAMLSVLALLMALVVGRMTLAGLEGAKVDGDRQLVALNLVLVYTWAALLSFWLASARAGRHVDW